MKELVYTCMINLRMAIMELFMAPPGVVMCHTSNQRDEGWATLNYGIGWNTLNQTMKKATV